jgi:hypothetical protein
VHIKDVLPTLQKNPLLLQALDQDSSSSKAPS